ncbi:DUF6113 family protein [Timonella sp. A28]|uniref:DUF6113 family protein n=1 Tax=Timonella sp. A28 TaxID=3442640 RepID=UPI003EBB17FF
MKSTAVERIVTTVEYGAAVILGVMVGAIGTVVHRQEVIPFVAVFAIACVFSAAVMMRAWLGLLGTGLYGVGWFVAVQVLSLSGPGGDVLLPAQILTYVWIGGGLLAIAVACFTPRAWYAE